MHDPKVYLDNEMTGRLKGIYGKNILWSRRHQLAKRKSTTCREEIMGPGTRSIGDHRRGESHGMGLEKCMGMN